jgi:prepilin-type N-terminal cleavage/methylation domain-containing protein
MVNASHPTSRTSRGQKGFSLVELMCVIAIMSLVASAAWPSIAGLIAGNRLTNNAYALGGLIQQARTTAITQHTYVWVGFSSTTQDGVPALLVASWVASSGLSTDLTTNSQLAAKPMILKNVQVATVANYSTLPGLDAADNTDVGTQAYTFTSSVDGKANVVFNNMIAFGPDGQANLPKTSGGSLQLVQCLGLGINAAPSGAKLHTVAVQVHGLSGQVAVFQQ